MTANAEARALLDQLMGVDRDALLPAGAALPRKNKRPLGDGGMILPGTKRSKSCYDRDIDPLYCAWGVDVYELFVNTKSDIGPNPYTADKAARKEYLSLPREEKERLGFESRLFVKLQELVQHCDRTVNRNHEKLKRELQRQAQKRGGNDYVVDVNEEKVEEVVRAECQLEDMQGDLVRALSTLNEVQFREEAVLEEQRKEQQQKVKDEEAAKKKDTGTEEKKTEETNGTATETEVKQDKQENVSPVKQVKTEDGGETTIVMDREGAEPSSTVQESAVKSEPESNDVVASQNEQPPDETSATASDPGIAKSTTSLEELGKLTLEKQKLLCQIATIITQLGPLEESIEILHAKLNFVRSDTTTDKTVCEVSGNFMSARDADERIAAHYAGKQYVGWKLVRDKYQEMVQKHGRYGPPRPGGRSGGSGSGPLLSHQKYQQMQQGGGHGGGGSGSDRDRDRYRGRGDDRRGGSSYGARWERSGGYGGGSRGGGDSRGGYDDRRRGGSGHGDRNRGGYRGGGGYGGRR